MAKIRINKLDAARRQLDSAVRMTFSEEDPVAIHSVVAAAHRVVRDICEKRGDIESYLRFTDWIAPGHEKDFWGAINASANFIKHADTDVDSIHEMDDETSDFMIAYASKWFRDLGNSPSIEMRTFLGWWALQNTKTLKPEVFSQSGFYHIYEKYLEMAEKMAPLSRNERLKIGLVMLNGAKRAAVGA
jgi:hypothetical protein